VFWEQSGSVRNVTGKDMNRTDASCALKKLLQLLVFPTHPAIAIRTEPRLRRNATRQAQPSQSTAQARMQATGIAGCELALAAARERDLARFGRHAVGYSASNPWSFISRHHQGDLLAFDPCGREGSGAKVEDLLNRPKLTQIPEDWGKGSSLIQ